MVTKVYKGDFWGLAELLKKQNEKGDLFAGMEKAFLAVIEAASGNYAVDGSDDEEIDWDPFIDLLIAWTERKMMEKEWRMIKDDFLIIDNRKQTDEEDKLDIGKIKEMLAGICQRTDTFEYSYWLSKIDEMMQYDGKEMEAVSVKSRIIEKINQSNWEVAAWLLYRIGGEEWSMEMLRREETMNFMVDGKEEDETAKRRRAMGQAQDSCYLDCCDFEEMMAYYDLAEGLKKAQTMNEFALASARLAVNIGYRVLFPYTACVVIIS